MEKTILKLGFILGKEEKFYERKKLFSIQENIEIINNCTYKVGIGNYSYVILSEIAFENFINYYKSLFEIPACNQYIFGVRLDENLKKLEKFEVVDIIKSLYIILEMFKILINNTSEGSWTRKEIIDLTLINLFRFGSFIGIYKEMKQINEYEFKFLSDTLNNFRKEIKD